MKTTLIGLVAIVAVLFGAECSQAQFTITIPKIPKIPKIKVSEAKKTPPTADTNQPAEISSPPEQSTAPTTPEVAAVEPKADACTDSWVAIHMKDINATRAEAEEFRPGLRDYYVSELSDRKNKYMEAALFSQERKEWYENSKQDAATRKCMDAGLDQLAAAARKTLPFYTGPAGYALGTPAEKKALAEAVDLTGGKVLRSGLKQANWLIAKDDYNLPTARYKHGMVLARYSTHDPGMCWLYWVNLKQDYAGGGTYGASYGYYVSRSVAGCPTGK